MELCLVSKALHTTLPASSSCQAHSKQQSGDSRQSQEGPELEDAPDEDGLGMEHDDVPDDMQDQFPNDDRLEQRPGVQLMEWVLPEQQLQEQAAAEIKQLEAQAFYCMAVAGPFVPSTQVLPRRALLIPIVNVILTHSQMCFARCVSCALNSAASHARHLLHYSVLE